MYIQCNKIYTNLHAGQFIAVVLIRLHERLPVLVLIVRLVGVQDYFEEDRLGGDPAEAVAEADLVVARLQVLESV